MTPTTSHIILYQSMSNQVIILAARPVPADEGMIVIVHGIGGIVIPAKMA
jgi:hypothetical protein